MSRYGFPWITGKEAEKVEFEEVRGTKGIKEAEYDLNGHIRDIRAIYRRKCGLMLECLERELPAAVSFTRPEGGLFVWCTLPQDCDMDAFVKQALEKRVAVVPGTAFLCDPDGKSQSFRINYSTPSDEEIREGCRRLGEAARSFGIK